MKIVTVLGTRPEIIRLSRVIARLEELCDHKLVYTGQNFTPELSTLFFDELKVKKPDYAFNSQAETTWRQIGNILAETEAVLRDEKPDRFLVLGDTNSALTALVAKRLAIPVYHMEAGNRCFDDRVPEEVNRRAIDHSSDVLLPYTNRSRDHLLREGFHPSRIYVTGNPIHEVMEHHKREIADSSILQTIGVASGQYFLVTLHRAENVDVPERLATFLDAFRQLYAKYSIPVLLSLHPRTRDRLASCGISLEGKGIIPFVPTGFFDFVHLEQHARALLSDSGTVQEEGCLLRVPTITLRDVTERPETIECGSNILTGCSADGILRACSIVLSQPPMWEVPPEYANGNVSGIVANILTGYR